MKLWLVACLVVFVSGCSTANRVTVLEDVQSNHKTELDDSGKLRFNNLFGGEKSYPVTCEENCYAPVAEVECQGSAEDCRYVGKQAPPKTNLGFSVHWLGHASFLIGTPDGKMIMLDPVSGQFDWPVNWAFRLTEGFNRQEPQWPSESQLADLDGVLYSHIHYDHFNKSDIAALGTQPKYFVPLAFADHFPSDGYDITEMSWFTHTQLGESTLHFVPAHHFSSRIWVPYIYEDNDKTLWGGWVLEQNGKRLFFAGDTGYSKHFATIRERLGDMDVCLLPIASYYHPEYSEWYRYVHTTPEDTLVAAEDLGCKVVVPWGYGNVSWKMGDHSSHSPLLRLLNMHRELKSTVPLYILNEGEKVVF